MPKVGDWSELRNVCVVTGTPRHASDITKDEIAIKQKDQKGGDTMDDSRLDKDEGSAAQLHDCLNLKPYHTKHTSNVPTKSMLSGHV